MHIKAICIFYNIVVTSVPQNIAKQRDVRRWSNLNCAFRIVLIRMGDFKRCTVNSPFCLGMTDCHWANQLRMTPCYHQSDLRIPSASKKCRRPPKVASLQMLQEALDGHFVPLEITHPDRHDPGCTIQIRASSDVMLLGNVLWFFIGMQLLAANRNCKLTHDQ